MHEPEESRNKELLELYKLHAELADRVSHRRGGANRLYVTVSTSFFVATTALARWGTEPILATAWFLTVAGILGVGLCASWYIVIRSYRQLNSGKFAALDELESKLAYPFFRREWEILEQGKNFKQYWKLTVAETSLPILFGIVYAGIAIYGLYNL